MTKVKIKYVGEHQPREIIEVDEITAKELVKTKNYEYVDDTKIFKDKKKDGRK